MKLSLINEATLDQVERRIPVWIKKYFDGDQQLAHEVIPKIIQADPTKGKYSEWLIRQWKNSTARFPEDTEKLQKNLSLFHKKKSKLPEKDINRYSPAELAKALEENLGLTKSQRKKARQGDIQLPPGAEYLGKIQNLEVVKITTPEAASILSSGTEWCTANREAARDYLDEGPLFLIYVDGGRKYLLHYESLQFMDVYDEELEPRRAFQLIGQISDLTGYSTENSPSLAFYYAKNVLGGRFPQGEPAIAQDPWLSLRYAKEIIDDRFPEGEPLIAQNARTAYEYAEQVIEGRFPQGEPTIPKHAAVAFKYAKNIIGGRWPKAEPTIIRQPTVAIWYAKDVIGGRWPEAEPNIAKDAWVANWYAKNIIGGRWPRAEPAIAENPKEACYYAREIVEGRWPEAEPTIAEDPEAAYLYAKEVIEGRFPQGESAIAKDVRYAYKYAKDVIKGRFPEGEPTILKDSRYAPIYQEFLRDYREFLWDRD